MDEIVSRALVSKNQAMSAFGKMLLSLLGSGLLLLLNGCGVTGPLRPSLTVEVSTRATIPVVANHVR
ncbi:MAG: hypothetical protein AB2992_04440 [Candidatus Symbiodolus clandestinus]